MKEFIESYNKILEDLRLLITINIFLVALFSNLFRLNSKIDSSTPIISGIFVVMPLFFYLAMRYKKKLLIYSPERIKITKAILFFSFLFFALFVLSLSLFYFYKLNWIMDAGYWIGIIYSFLLLGLGCCGIYSFFLKK